MKRESINLITKFSQSRRSRSAGQARADNDYFELALIVRVDEFGVSLIVVPLFVQGTIWNLGI